MHTFKALMCILAVAVVTACGAPAASPTQSAASVGLTYIPNIQFAPFYAAESKGYFTDAGAQVTLRHHGSNEGLFTAVLSGEEDFVLAGAAEMMQARAEGPDLVAVASFYRDFPVRIIVPDTTPYSSAKDLVGKKIGVPGRFGESWLGLQAFLHEANLTESDVEIVEIGYTQQAALTTGKVDAVVGHVNNDAVSFDLAGFPVRSIPVADEVPLVSASLITTREFADKHPETVKAVVAGMLKGIDFSINNVDETIELSAQQIPTLTSTSETTAARATLEATIPLWSANGGANGRLDENQFEAMASFMEKTSMVSKPVSASESFTNQYVPQ